MRFEHLVIVELSMIDGSPSAEYSSEIARANEEIEDRLKHWAADNQSRTNKGAVASFYGTLRYPIEAKITVR